jgi:hypothetical protein
LVPGHDSKPRVKLPGVKVTKLGTDRGRRKVRFAVMDLSLPTPGIVFTHNNSVDNLLRGLGERLYYVKEGDEYVSPPAPTIFDLGDYRNRVCTP